MSPKNLTSDQIHALAVCKHMMSEHFDAGCIVVTWLAKNQTFDFCLEWGLRGAVQKLAEDFVSEDLGCQMEEEITPPPKPDEDGGWEKEVPA
jgi:hypothetical protein